MNKRIALVLLLGTGILVACRSRTESGQVGFLFGDYALVVRDRQLDVVEVARPDSPRWVATIDLPGRITAVKTRGRYAYVTHDPSVNSWIGEPPDGGMQIIDISNPRRPFSVGLYHALGLAQDVAVTDEVAYVADWDGLRIVDIRNPSGPVEIATLTDGMNGVAITGQTLVGVWGSCSIRTSHCAGGLWTADISNPATPVELATFRPDQIPGYSVAFVGDRAYVAGNGVWQVRLSDPAAPAPGQIYELLDEGRYQAQVAVSGNHVLFFGGKGLRILDATVPDNLSEVSFLPMSAFISDVAVRGDYLYTISNQGLHVIDIHDPSHPEIVGYYSGVR